jgi:hypothetical protein
MRIASISKPITAALVARLVDAGKLDLDKDIRQVVFECLSVYILHLCSVSGIEKVL